MKFELRLKKDKTIYPRIVHHFKAIPDDLLYHENHSLRHPGAIFNVGFDRVIGSFSGVLTQLKAIKSDKENIEYWNNLLQQQKRLFYDLGSFYDDCYLVLKSLCPPSKKNPKFADKWLKANNYRCGERFYQATKMVQAFWMEIVNRLKHNNANLRGLYGYGNYFIIPGFFVEGISNDGTVGPDEAIHKKYLNKATAFSFNRDLRINFFYLYFVAESLLEVIKGHIKQQANYKFGNITYDKANDTILDKICAELSDLELKFFPDEMREPYPKITYDRNELAITYSHREGIFRYSNMTVKLMYSGDGYSRSFYLPYYLGTVSDTKQALEQQL